MFPRDSIDAASASIILVLATSNGVVTRAENPPVIYVKIIHHDASSLIYRSILF